MAVAISCVDTRTDTLRQYMAAEWLKVDAEGQAGESREAAENGATRLRSGGWGVAEECVWRAWLQQQLVII